MGRPPVVRTDDAPYATRSSVGERLASLIARGASALDADDQNFVFAIFEAAHQISTESAVWRGHSRTLTVVQRARRPMLRWVAEEEDEDLEIELDAHFDTEVQALLDDKKRHNYNEINAFVDKIGIVFETPSSKGDGPNLERHYYTTEDERPLRDWLEQAGVPPERIDAVLWKIRNVVAAETRPKWLGRVERGGRLATLTAPKFLKEVHHEIVAPDGTVWKEDVGARDPALLKALDKYIGQRLARKNSAGAAEVLQQPDMGDAEGLRLILVRPATSAAMKGRRRSPAP